MYNNFYGFKAKPFQMTPDHDLLYMAPGHKEALACMEYGLIADTGIVMITGEVGTGKTTLIRRFLSDLPADVRVACILNTNITSEQLLELFLQEFGLSGHYRQKAQVIKAIQRGLQTMRADKQRPLLIIDDAQNLSERALEEVRWLSNLQDDRRMLVQVILVGQPELKVKMSNPAMVSLAQRIGVTYHLGPFSREEVATYVMHRLSRVGGPTDLFTKNAVDLIYETSKGIPRVINLLCDNSLVSAFAEDIQIVNRSIVENAVAEDSQSPLAAALMRLGAANSASTSQENSSIHKGDQEPGSFGKKFRQMEIRMETLTKLVSQTNLEMRNMIKSLLIDERKKNDKLLEENVLLKADRKLRSKKTNYGQAIPADSQNSNLHETEILELGIKKRRD